MTDLERSKIKKRMNQLMVPINQQIMMCDTQEEMLMLACAMMQRTDEILVQLLGKDARNIMYQELL